MRDKRNIIYSVEAEGMRRLLAFLSEDCCHGRPEICGGRPRPADTPADSPIEILKA